MLTGRNISDKEYEHLLKVRNKFEIKKMKNYHNLYLKCDVLLLADVFEEFRNNSLKDYGLCSSHYLSAPALSWVAVLNMKKVEIKLIRDPNMYIFLIILIDIVKPTTSIWSHMTQNKNQNILYT